MANLSYLPPDDDFVPDPEDEIVEDYRTPLSLVSPGADADDEAFLLKVTERASDLTLNRSTKAKHHLESFTFKLALPMGPQLKAMSERWALPYTYVMRALAEVAISQLRSPTKALSDRLEKHVLEVEARKAANKRKQREHMGVTS
jgi:hypothetical protein